MQGQWLGRANGDNNGQIVVNIEEREGSLTGNAILWELQEGVPSVVFDIKVEEQGCELTIHGYNIRALNPFTGRIIPRNQIPAFYPEGFIANSVEIKAQITPDGTNIFGEYSADKGMEGSINLEKCSAFDSLTTSEEVSWDEFKTKVLQPSSSPPIYRGQNDSRWPLRTSFHRTNRVDLTRYFNKDIRKLYRRIHALTGMKFDLQSSKDDFDSLIYLAQHHGYPTPLLDWSLSPFIAAYFAFEDCDEVPKDKPCCDVAIYKNRRKPTHVRVFCLDIEQWKDNSFQSEWIDTFGITISFIECLPAGNNRSSPQQAVSTLSNIDFIEPYLNTMHPSGSGKYLKAFDIPIQYKAEALRELRIMGIHRASLYPDLANLCADLKENDFS